MTRAIAFACGLVVLAPGCVPRDAGYADAKRLVAGRTGHTVRWSRLDGGSEAARATRELLAKPLTAESAAQIALLNNPEMQAAFEEVGMARAGLVAARRIPNPTAEAGLGFSPARDEPDVDLAATVDLAELLLLPMRSGAAGAKLDAASLEVAGAAMDLALEAKIAFYRVQAERQILELRKTVLLAARASYDAAKSMHEADNMTDLDLANERALYEEARLGVAGADAGLAGATEELAAVLGVWGAGPRFTVEGRLADPPDAGPDVASLEARALEKSVDLAVARRMFEAAARRANFEQTRGWLPELKAGVGAEREEGTWGVGPVGEIEIPLFYQGQGEVAAAEAEMRQHEQRFRALAVRLRAAARSASARYQAARDRAQFYRNTLLPVRERILQETQLAYNAMGLGVFQLLQAKRDQIEAGRQYVEALRDYWIARAQVEQLLAGRLVRGAGAMPAPIGPAGPDRRAEEH